MNKIKELRYKKTRQQLRYVQLELEETQMVYEDCVDKFNIEFKEELMDSRDSEDPITDIDDSHFKKIFNKSNLKEVLLSLCFFKID